MRVATSSSGPGRSREPVAVPDHLGGIATAIGSWPGTDPRESAAVVVGELTDLPHIVELPARGVGADMVGRGGAFLVDMHFDISTRGYRLGRASAVSRRAARFLREDLDALEEAWETAGFMGAGKSVKVQVCGPLTLAASVELANGHRVLTDRGAVRDLTESLAEGVGQHMAEVRRRLRGDIVLQVDEPLLPAVVAGTLRGVTGVDRVRAIPAPEALELLDAVATGGFVHSCAADTPFDLLRRSKAVAVGVDLSLVRAGDLDRLGELLDAGKTLALGLVPTTDPGPRPGWRDLAAPAVTLVDRLGFPRSTLTERVVVTPACGLAGTSNAWARAALRLSSDIARAFAEEPESL